MNIDDHDSIEVSESKISVTRIYNLKYVLLHFAAFEYFETIISKFTVVKFFIGIAELLNESNIISYTLPAYASIFSRRTNPLITFS